jgi:hypothetical protein
VTIHHASDVERGLAVWRFAGDNGDADWRTYIDTIQDLDARCPEGVRGAGLTVFEGRSPPPSARWLKEIANGTAKLRMDNPLFALVSERMLVRGMVSAINKIRPAPYESAAHKNLSSAIAWLEAGRGEPVGARLRELLAECGG